MKKIVLFIALISLAGSAAWAGGKQGAAGTRREQLVQNYTAKNPARVAAAEELFRAAREGDVESIARVKNISVLLMQDKFGNNCFHLAKDARTLQALAGVVRQLKPTQAVSIISQLRNQRNRMGETPLMAHINYGKSDTFFLLYKRSDLAAAITQAKGVDKGGALSPTAEIQKGVVISLSKDNSGRTVAQAAKANGVTNAVAFFEKNAPYLF